MSTVKKRLHLSGLTPAITVNDINARLQGFGKILALDGVGALNAVGEPRKFAYVTLEVTETNLARCLNVLSGTTWKGTKLRIGEAKLDYVQRLEDERKRVAEGQEELHSKRRRLPRGVQGVHAGDMSAVSLKNLSLHPAWHKTSLSHLIRPMKMRPLHPLPEPHSKHRLDTKNKRRKKLSSLAVPTRARVRVIDPRMYGSVHLRENMLKAVVESHPSQPTNMRSVSPSSSASVGSPLEEDVHQESKSTFAADEDESIAIPDLEQEKARDLNLLMTMFGDDERQWGGEESAEDVISDGPDEMPDVQTGVKLVTETKAEHAASAPVKSKSKSLKDMFQPHEEEAGFSLMASLGDLDLDLDPAFDLDAPAPISTTTPNVSIVSIPAPMQPGGFMLDPSLPLFFPQPDNPRAKDMFSFSRIEGWEFGRTGDSDTIRKRWDDTKGALTREWKKRAREAVKARKRRYGVPEGEDA